MGHMTTPSQILASNLLILVTRFMHRYDPTAYNTDLAMATLPDVVYNRLRAAILAGQYRPAQLLRQEELAVSLGVSRAPLREALPRLEADGLVVSQPRRGYTVRALTQEEIVEIFDLRLQLEGSAMAFATQARSERDVKEIDALLTRLEAIHPQTQEEIKVWSELNFEFHDRLLAPCPREFQKKIVRNLRATVEPILRLEIQLTADMSEADAEHRKLFQAFADGDATLAEELSREHFIDTKLRLIDAVKARQKLES
jgi:DNA-binding GntR family transcriptional regulator